MCRVSFSLVLSFRSMNANRTTLAPAVTQGGFAVLPLVGVSGSPCPITT